MVSVTADTLQKNGNYRPYCDKLRKILKMNKQNVNILFLRLNNKHKISIRNLMVSEIVPFIDI